LVSLAQVRESDIDVDVAYLLPHKGHLVPELTAAGAGVHLLSGRRGLADPRWPLRLLRLIRRTRPDVVHLHSPAAAAITRPLVRLLPTRPVLVSTEHNVWSSFGRLTRAANAVTARLDDVRFAVSDEVRASAGPRHQDRMETLIQGIPVGALASRRVERAGARRALGITDEHVLVATVANFREKKDYPTLLAAAAACVDEPRLRFVAVGQGPLEAELRALHHRLQLADRFQFLGYRADPAAVLAAADVFVLTSRHEGLPIALLEAMALGVAPVVTAVGGIPEVVTDGHDALLVPPGDVAAVVAAIRRLADEPGTRRRLGAGAMRRAAAFDITTTQRALVARYRELLAEP
jgi:glycosyltransferase involved in cell wall biosynthesis